MIMTKIKNRLTLLIMLMAIISTSAMMAQIVLSGKVLDTEKMPVDFATVRLKGTQQGCSTDERGIYHLKVPAGEHVLVVSSVGYETVEKHVSLSSERGSRQKLHITLKPTSYELNEVTVSASGMSRVKSSAFNAVAVDTKELQNSTKNLGQALTALPGVRMREAGGVGSDNQIMLDGFSGRHIKVFIDGVPQEGTGTGFSLNNLPVNYAERIEVYKGVVPVGFGADAIGGVVNVVTKKNVNRFSVDASYSFGSFNTHKSNLNISHKLKSGLFYEVNAFQNYSDNNYYVNNWVRTFTVNPDGSVTKHPVDKTDIKRVKRFNDTFHNEAVIGKVGVKEKPWADRLWLGMGYSKFYKEIQTGVYQEIVFGQKHRHGYSMLPAFEYSKHNLFVKGLDVQLHANYNHNITYNVDTTARYYNWYGQYYTKESQGEQSYQNSEQKNQNWNVTASINHRFGKVHSVSFNHVHSGFRRTSRSYIGTSSALTSFNIPKLTRKDISGLAYKIVPSDRWNATAFIKYYNQHSEGAISGNADGVGNYVKQSKQVSALGYGAAGSYHIIKNLQAKLSYEKAYRLPTNDELFGDEDLEAGKTDLRPEKSDNFNLNLNYNWQTGKHGWYVEAALIYRDTKDFIKRGIGKHGVLQYGIYENHGHVKTKGYNLALRYKYGSWLSVGGAFNNADTRDYEPYYAAGSGQKNVHYKDRLPNIPFRYANADANFYWHNLFREGNTFTLTYDMMWQHEFPLYWESIGNKEDKNSVPTQCAHNVSLTYSMKRGRYNLSFECNNLTDAKLYDNFSLQRAGRAFYGKVRIHI